MSFVDVRGLFVTYGRVRAVRGISFCIPKGEVFGLIGPNGAGKSSTIKVLATLVKPTYGRVRIGTLDVTKHPTGVRRTIGYVPDFFGVYDDLTVREYLHFFAAAYGIVGRRRRSIVDSVLQITDLTEKIDSNVDFLSRGMKQRLGIARVLLHDPELLLLDEPASGLDPRARVEMRALLRELKRMGKTVLISSHILHELQKFCTRIGIMEAGRMVTEGPIEQIYKGLDTHRVVQVRVVNHSEALADRVREIEGVLSVEDEDSHWLLRVHEDQIALEELLAHLHELGARVSLFRPAGMDMEAAFMKLTAGKTA